MRKKITSIVLLLFGVMFLLCACNMATEQGENKSNTSEEAIVVLNQRQKDILSQMNLPKNYEELTIIQKNAIVAIEDMLSYLENKYDETFTYSGYYEASSAEEEHLTAVCSLGVVTVYRSRENGQYSYNDNYLAISASPQYQEAISNYLAEFFEGGKYKVFSVVNSISNTEVMLLHGASAVSYVFFDSTVTETEFAVFVSHYADWIKEQANGNATITKFYLLQNDDLGNIYDFNYEEKVLESIYTKKLCCSISDSGEINIF